MQALIALAALAFTGWYGVHSLAGDENFVVGPRIVGGAQADLPDTPEEWEGRIDYAALDRQFAALTARPEMAGMAVAVIENGKLSFVRTYGVADKSTGAAVTPDTVFRWASVSKTVAGTMAATLASEASVDLEAPVASWPSTLRLPGGAQSRVTLAQLLSHQTGLTKNAYDERLEDGQSPVAVRGQLVAAPLQCQPGTCHTYQNVAFDAASEILAQATNRSYSDLVAERFFLPLDMKSASFGMAGLTGAKNWARPHNGSQVRTLKESYWRVPAAAGVNSNIVDFARWMQATMGDREDVIPASVLKVAQMPRVRTARLYGGPLRQAIEDANYGLGWRSFTYAGRLMRGHSGAVDGFRTTLIFEPQTRTGVVVMWNSNWGRPFRVPFAVFDSYHRQPDSNWLELDDLPEATADAEG
ncbi:MAG TPA: serine hydrolase domain-containing protein [Sphingorhabdus sp.]|nr:serine hydrolase domain-containing protein [Sphingorhabdus sp.]